MHYAHFMSAAETAAELGHDASLRMMQRHYLNQVTPAEAQAFWQIITADLCRRRKMDAEFSLDQVAFRMTLTYGQMRLPTNNSTGR
jgi:hypothetical protein